MAGLRESVRCAVGCRDGSNAGVAYAVPASSLTGAVGDNITPGTGKQIIWNAGVDWDGEYSTQMRVKVIASDLQSERYERGHLFMGPVVGPARMSVDTSNGTQFAPHHGEVQPRPARGPRRRGR